MRRSIVTWLALAVLGACDHSAPPSPDVHVAPRAPASAATTRAPGASDARSDGAAAASSMPDAVPGFVDTLWRVGADSGVEAGTTYTFLRDGTLAIDAPHGTPSIGRWRYVGGKLTVTEEGIDYPTDIVALDATRFVIRSHNPGGSVEIAMVADARLDVMTPSNAPSGITRKPYSP